VLKLSILVVSTVLSFAAGWAADEAGCYIMWSFLWSGFGAVFGCWLGWWLHERFLR
jgi:hypothetical protein